MRVIFTFTYGNYSIIWCFNGSTLQQYSPNCGWSPESRLSRLGLRSQVYWLSRWPKCITLATRTRAESAFLGKNARSTAQVMLLHGAPTQTPQQHLQHILHFPKLSIALEQYLKKCSGLLCEEHKPSPQVCPAMAKMVILNAHSRSKLLRRRRGGGWHWAGWRSFVACACSAQACVAFDK